ncbi:hypothetical protein SAMN05216311_116186 [Chitinophaga sp. CF418]|nr:hypothetical protein SAMN05216311_116186 [Chitinophaga sp. CF418]
MEEVFIIPTVKVKARAIRYEMKSEKRFNSMSLNTSIKTNILNSV